MLRGRALNVLPQYSKEAEDCLSKAVKLEPKLAEAWSHLGECYWKNNQVESARNCFVGSLNHVSLCSYLIIVLLSCKLTEDVAVYWVWVDGGQNFQSKFTSG